MAKRKKCYALTLYVTARIINHISAQCVHGVNDNCRASITKERALSTKRVVGLAFGVNHRGGRDAMATSKLVITSEDSSGRSTVHKVSPVETYSTPIFSLQNIWKVEPGWNLPIPGPVPATVPDMAGIVPGEVQVFCWTIPASIEVDRGDESAGGDIVGFHNDRPGFHSSPTIDVQTCIAGEVTLLVDDQEVALKVGDTAILHGQRHAWANRGEVPATILITAIGAHRVSEDSWLSQ